MLRGHAIGALEEGAVKGQVERPAVEAFLRCAAAAEVPPYQFPGLGIDVRLNAPGGWGACLLVDDAAGHLELLPQEARRLRADR